MFGFSVGGRTTWIRFAHELPYHSGLSTLLHIRQVRILYLKHDLWCFLLFSFMFVCNVGNVYHLLSHTSFSPLFCCHGSLELQVNASLCNFIVLYFAKVIDYNVLVLVF